MATTLCMMEASSMAGCVILLILGIVLVVKGGDWFVDAASWIAEVSGIPTFIIGATIVSLATTLPEILVSSLSAAQGVEGAGLAIGNAVGSVNCNIALIMAISLLFMPAAFKRKDYAAKMILLLVAVSVLWTVSAIASDVTWWESLIVLAVFVAFMVENILSAKKHSSGILEPVEADSTAMQASAKQSSDEPAKFGVLGYYAQKQDAKKITLKKSGMVIERKDIVKNIFLFILGAGAIFVGAQLMSDNGALFATKLGMSKDLVGVTILAVGTSLPELVTTITAIAKKKSDLSVGNVIGANIIDITLILPLCGIISVSKFGVPLPVSAQTTVLDFPFCLAVAAVALIPALIMGKFKRWQGALLLAGYVTYITLLILNTTGTVAIF